MRQLRVLPILASLTLLTFGVCTFHVSTASACSYAAPEPGFDWGVPADGATDVPTDVVPYYPIPLSLTDSGSDAVPGTFTLTAAGGATVSLAPRRVHYWNFELVPSTALEPNTEYTLHGSWTVGSDVFDRDLHFTTGNGPLQGEPPIPNAKMEHYHSATPIQNSCSPQAAATCVSYGDPNALVESTDVDEFNQLKPPYLWRGSSITNLSGINQGTNFRCVLLRTRALNGTYGPARALCGSDVEVLEVATSEGIECTSAGLVVPTTDAGTLEPSDDDAGAVDETTESGADAATSSADASDDQTAEDAGLQASQPHASEPASSSCTVRPASHLGSAAPTGFLLMALVLLVLRRRA